MKKIAKLLKADFGESSDLASIAAMLQNKGRGKDTILAHITPDEAELLKKLGGRGSTNPETGLLEFENEIYDFAPTPAPTEQFGDFQPGGQAPEQIAAANPDLYAGGQLPPAGYGTQFSPTPRAQTSQAEDVSFGGTAGGGGGQALPTGGVAFSPTGQAYTPRDLARLSVGKEALTQQVEPTPPPQEKSFFDKLTTDQMVRLGLAGGLGIYGAQQAKKGAEQAKQASEEQRAVGAPYQAKGKELIRAAESGELTPTSQQQLQALQARLAQGAESRGGVGAAQVAQQAEAYRQQLLAQQYNLGLQVSNIGDQIALGAIRTGLQADQMLNQASTNFYTNLAAIGAGIPMYGTGSGTQTRTV